MTQDANQTEDDRHAAKMAKKKAAVIYIEANADTPKEEADKLQAILASIKPPGK